MLFFQAALLAGYGFAHRTSRPSARKQTLLQLALLAAAAVVLPIGVPDASPPQSGSALAAGPAGQPTRRLRRPFLENASVLVHHPDGPALCPQQA